MDPLTNPAYLLFAAFIAPPIISLVKQSGFPTWVNAVIAFIAYVVVGVVGALMAGEELSGDNLVTFVTVAGVVGTAAYNLLWNNLGKQTTGDEGLESRLNDATSFIKPSSDGEPTDSIL